MGKRERNRRRGVKPAMIALTSVQAA